MPDFPCFTPQVFLANPFATKDPGSGNPAAVIILDRPVSDLNMSWAARYWLPESSFAYRHSAGNWFVHSYTPDGKPLVPGGNSIIALAKVLLTQIEPSVQKVHMRYPLDTSLDSTAELEEDGRVSVCIPSVSAANIIPWEKNRLIEAIGDGQIAFLEGQQDLTCVYETEREVRAIVPRFWALHGTQYRAVVATAPGDRGGFVYRTFVDAEGQGWECPGSARALMNLVPYWDVKLPTSTQFMPAWQLSPRGGAALTRIVCPDERGCQVQVITDCPIRSGPFLVDFDDMDGGAEPTISPNPSNTTWY